MTTIPKPSPDAGGRHALEVAAVFALALAVRLAGIHQEAFGDELYHVLAARHYLETGSLVIGGTEPYTRVRGFTLLVAALFRMFGESLAVGRLPAILCGSALPAAVFLWVRRAGDRPAAWIAALLVCFNHDLISISQMVRFYAPQQLAFFLATAAVAGMVAATGTRARLAAALGALVALAVAVYCQVNTLVGVAGLALFIAIAWAGPVWRWAAARTARRVALAAGVGVVVVVAFLSSETARRFWQLATFTPLWQADSARNPLYYHWYLLGDYPTLWTLSPLLGLAALGRRPRMATCCAAVFAIAFVALSLLPPKNGRYLLFVLPHLLVLSALGAAGALAALGRGVTAWMESRGVGERWIGATVVAALAAITAASNPGIVASVRVLATDRSHSYPGYEGPPLSWREAAAVLRPQLDSAEAVVSTDGLKSLYYLGRIDYVLSRTDLVSERGVNPEFSPAPSLGAPAISRAESVIRLTRCYRSGIFVSAGYAFQTAWRLPPETREAVRTEMRSLPLPTRTGMVAFVWRRVGPSAPDCGTLPRGETAR